MDSIMCSVVTEPLYSNDICTFKVDVQGKMFTVISGKQQAVKDNIFVTCGQNIIIDGIISGDIIITNNSIILLK